MIEKLFKIDFDF